MINIIKQNRTSILTGEIGALLHDIGKCHPDFIKKNSSENIDNFNHCDIDSFLNKEFVKLVKNNKFEFTINNDNSSVYSIINEHHNTNNKNKIIKILQSCDRLDSAEDKGIVRRKQSKDNTIISSPFGFPKETIDLQCLQKRLDNLQSDLIGLFQNYTSDICNNIFCFRKSLIDKLKTTFSHALGETRIPANDVTLWDHSHSTATLFKSALCAMALGANHSEQKLKWHILGFCWDGISFINKGQKVANIHARFKIIESIKNALKHKFEVKIPIGNAIYEDNNGIYFTFPALGNSKSIKLAKECVDKALNIIYDISNNEIWPFFTLSNSSRSLTSLLSGELKFASQKRNISKMTPKLFVKGQKEDIILVNPDIQIEKDREGNDICPDCRLRAKPKDRDSCIICAKRSTGRVNEWSKNRENTIWIDEVADTNNRIALLTFSFDLDKWLDGTMVGTIYSQSFEDWLFSNERKNKNNGGIQESTIQLLKDAGINKNQPLLPDINTAYNLLEKVIISYRSNPHNINNSAIILNSFFQDITISHNSFNNHMDNIQNSIGTDNLTKEILAAHIFTQNPSPARLYRIWNETEDFFDLTLNNIRTELYPIKSKRIKFSFNNKDLKSKIKLNNIDNSPFIIKIKNLEPKTLLIFHAKDGDIYTIESLEKFKYKDICGSNAVVEALKEGIYWIAEEDKPNINLLEKNTLITINSNAKQEDYYPIIEISKSPLLLRLIVPASDSVKILESINKLYNERFEKVIGKLPLSISLLVTKRKFPLYVLLDTGKMMLKSKDFKNPVIMDPWWNIVGLKDDKYYGFYPIKKPDNQKYYLDHLVPLSKGKLYSLYPGYFDFDLLLGTSDRSHINYKQLKRADKDYQLYSNRPYYFFQILEIIDLGVILVNNLSSSQINYIEEMLVGKLREWRNVNDNSKKDVFKKFTEATVKDAFGETWIELRNEIQDFIMNSAFNGLLLDTISLFNHIIKNWEVNKNERT